MSFLGLYKTSHPIEIPRPNVKECEVMRVLNNALPSSPPYKVTKADPDHGPPERIRNKADEQRDVRWLNVVAKKHGDVWVGIFSTDQITKIRVYPGNSVSHFVARRIRWLLVGASSELRVVPPPRGVLPPRGAALSHANPDLANLLGVYANQFASYTTLLWQVPALGLTAQAFLLTIALDNATSRWAKITASVISIIIALASWLLMHNQRGRAINHGELLRRVSQKLSLRDVLGDSVEVDDAVPQKTDAQNVWGVDRSIYHVWRGCMILFVFADALIIVVTACNLSWFK